MGRPSAPISSNSSGRLMAWFAAEDCSARDRPAISCFRTCSGATRTFGVALPDRGERVRVLLLAMATWSSPLRGRTGTAGGKTRRSDRKLLRRSPAGFRGAQVDRGKWRCFGTRRGPGRPRRKTRRRESARPASLRGIPHATAPCTAALRKPFRTRAGTGRAGHFSRGSAWRSVRGGVFPAPQ